MPVTNRQESDDEPTTTKSRKKTQIPAVKKETSLKLPTELKGILATLATQEFASLTPSSQITLLYALYEEAAATEVVQDEMKKRKEALVRLQQEFYSISSQLREISALYSRQEFSNRNAFITGVVERGLPAKQQEEMLSFNYKPSDKSKVVAEKNLAAFLAKKSSVLADLKARLADVESRIMVASKALWSPTPLGGDRFGNKYFWFPDDKPLRVWVINENDGNCGYFWSSEQLLMLMNWLDNRGKEEHILYSVLKRIGLQFTQFIETELSGLPVIPSISGNDLTARKRKELAGRDLVLCDVDGSLSLRQLHGQWIGVPVVDNDQNEWWRCAKKEGVVSETVKAIIDVLFQPAFMKEGKSELVSTLQEQWRRLHTEGASLEAYKTLVLLLEETIFESIHTSYMNPDWLLARSLWTTRVRDSQTFSDVSYYLRDIEASCVNFTVINALTRSVDRTTFLGLYEKQAKKVPRLPDDGETVVYCAKGHAVAIQDFFQNNAFGSVYHCTEKEQDRDYLCKVHHVEYFWGNGNPFLRVYLTPISPLVLYSLVQSYYDCLGKDELSITVRTPPPEPNGAPFTVVVWLASTNSEFVVPFDSYCGAFVNNLRVGNHIRMWFDGVDAQITASKRRRKESRLEGSYLTGKVTGIERCEGCSFPWECLEVAWSSNTNEAGTNRINPWECEYQEKDTRDRVRENTRSGWKSGEVKKLSENDLKSIRESAQAIVKAHTPEEGEQFYRFLTRYWNEKGQEVTKPILSYETLDLGLFWKLMQAFGGYEMVVNSKGSWQSIYRLLPNFREQNTSAPTSLHKIYLKYLWQFEKEQREEKGMAPICQPRLPIPTMPGRSTMKTKGEKEEPEKEGNDELIMMDYPPNVQFMVRTVKEQEKLKSVLTSKVKSMQNTLQYKEGTISTVNVEVSDFAFRGIVHGSVCMLKRQIESISKFISQLKQILNFYL